MLTYNFENIGSDTLYEYLYKCIKNDIIQGKIKSGEKLPSKRALAKNLAISVITVENAYGQLAAEGYIYSVPKSGFYVADLRDDRMKSESGLSENRIYSNKLNLTGGKNAYIADFTSNQTEQSAFPFSIWTTQSLGKCIHINHFSRYINALKRWNWLTVQSKFTVIFIFYNISIFRFCHPAK